MSRSLPYCCGWAPNKLVLSSSHSLFAKLYSSFRASCIISDYSLPVHFCMYRKGALFSSAFHRLIVPTQCTYLVTPKWWIDINTRSALSSCYLFWSVIFFSVSFLLSPPVPVLPFPLPFALPRLLFLLFFSSFHCSLFISLVHFPFFYPELLFLSKRIILQIYHSEGKSYSFCIFYEFARFQAEVLTTVVGRQWW